MDFIQQYGPNVLAGLIPSLLTFAQATYLIIKNLKVNNNVNDLLILANDLKVDKFDLEAIMEKAAPLVEAALNDFKEDFIVERDILVENMKETFETATNDLLQAFDEHTKVMQMQISRITAENKRLKLGADKNEDVPTL